MKPLNSLLLEYNPETEALFKKIIQEITERIEDVETASNFFTVKKIKETKYEIGFVWKNKFKIEVKREKTPLIPEISVSFDEISVRIANYPIPERLCLEMVEAIERRMKKEIHRHLQKLMP